MTKVHQDKFGRPGGNCYQAAMASLLELPLSDVPDFCNDATNAGDAFGWFRPVSDWIAGRGLFAIYIDLGKPPYAGLIEGLCILGVRLKCHAPDDVMLHAVVGNSELVGEEWRHTVIHDPHPDKPEIVEVKDVTFIVRNAASSST